MPSHCPPGPGAVLPRARLVAAFAAMQSAGFAQRTANGEPLGREGAFAS